MLTLKGHSGQVMALAFSPDGRWLASAGWDGTVRLWERPSYRQVRCMRTPYDHALTVAFSPDGGHLAVGFRNHDLSHDPRGFGTLAWTKTLPRGGAEPDSIPFQDTWNAFQSATRLVAIHPAGKLVATCGLSKEMIVWDPATREVAWRWIPIGHVSDLTFSSNGRFLGAIAANDLNSELSLWYTEERDAVEQKFFPGHARAIAFSPDGCFVFVGCSPGSILSSRITSERSPDATTGHRAVPPPGFQIPLDDDLLVDLPKVPLTSPILDMSFSPDGRSLLLACEDGLIRLWDVAGRRVQTTFDWVIGSLGCVAFAPDGLTAAAGGDGVILVWDVD